MKQAIIKGSFNTDDWFEAGDCDHCDFYILGYGRDDFDRCVFGKSSEDCPVDIIDEKNTP